jgi:uncharacterized membrane protein YbaN (DUF454 family)
MNEYSKTDGHHRSRPWRIVLAGVGLVSVGLATLGAILPGMPTTVFLLVASYCFAKSCPSLEERLLKRNPIFRPYLALVEEGRPMPRHAKIVAIVAMWAFIGASMVAFQGMGTVGTAFTAGIVAAGLVGTVAIARFRRGSVRTEAAEGGNRAGFGRKVGARVDARSHSSF